MDISIIIPLYNASRYIESALHSICSQSMAQGVEVVLIDDCSSDDCFAVVSRFISRYDGDIRFVMLRNERNMGPGETRNRGVEQATGKFVLFMDADDLLLPDMLEKMYGAAVQYEVQVVYCHFAYISPEGKISEEMSSFSKYPLVATGCYKGGDIKRISNHLLGVPWGKLILREFLVAENIFFSSAYREEDSCWWGECLFVMKSLYVVREPLYGYRKGHDSLMVQNNRDEYMWEQKVINFRHLYSFLWTKGLLSEKENCVAMQRKWTFLVKYAMRLDSDKCTKYKRLRSLDSYLHETLKEGRLKWTDYMNVLHVFMPPSIGYCFMLMLSKVKRKK